jgi:hypothetical protein
MKYAVEIDPDVMIYISSFIKIGSRIQKEGGGMIHRHTAWRFHKPTFIISK